MGWENTVKNVEHVTDKTVRELVNDALEVALTRPGFIGDIVGNGMGDILSCDISRPSATIHQVRIRTRNSGTFYVEVKASVKY